MFAMIGVSSARYIHGDDVLWQYSTICDAERPEALWSTELRKQIATMAQILNLYCPIHTLQWISTMSYATSSVVCRMTSHDLEEVEKQTCDVMRGTFNMLNFDLRLVPVHLI